MYDAIVVGARCGGSPTAMLLARKGYRVLLIDRSTFPSDIYKNHFIRHEGIVQLHGWGLLERLQQSNCPPIRKQIMDLGDFPFTINWPATDGVDAEYAPRRVVLDKILVDAAVEAGAELREGFSVSEVLVEDGRVTGIRGRSRHGETVTERAPIVIGADGQHSIVARTVDAPIYRARPVLTCGYYSYWSGIDCDGMEIYMRDYPALILAFPTNDGLTCVAEQVPVSHFAAFRTDIESNFLRILEQAPDLAWRVSQGKREQRFTGTADLQNFFRKPYGAGWALVGDAGYVKDPYTARGISDAFRDAELLTDAIDEAFSGRLPYNEALSGYERKRNEAGMPGYEETCAMASFRPLPAEMFQWRDMLLATGQASRPPVPVA